MIRGVSNHLVISVLQKVPIKAFVPKTPQNRACEDPALPIAFKQTVSQSLMDALMSEDLDLQGSERAPEVCNESGYQTPILPKIIEAEEMLWSIERHVNPWRSAGEKIL